MEFMIVTGLSGAGKSQASHALEDIGYYCIDNIPSELLEKFFMLCSDSANKDGRFAAVVDIRAVTAFGTLGELQKRFEPLNIQPKILYLDAVDEVIIRRYKETRRRHPLLDLGEVTTLQQAVSLERDKLSQARESADFVIDTSSISPAQLKERVTQLFSNPQEGTMTVSITSFGFKYGLPSDSDLVFDVRCLPNPHYIDALRPLTGREEAVSGYVFGFEESVGMYEHILSLISFSLPLYRTEGKSRLVISIGCTGGKHRSVAFVERLAKKLQEDGETVVLSHRDVAR